MALGGSLRSEQVEGQSRKPLMQENDESQEGCLLDPVDSASLHEQLVAYTDAICGALSWEERSGIWSEHSYARARSGGPSASVRVLLAPPAPRSSGAPADYVDVIGEPRAAPPLPRDLADREPDAPDCIESDDDWEERVVAHPPSRAHARLARAALQALSDARLARLASGRGRAARREEARVAARRLRLALAPLWAWSGAPPLRPPAWMHAQLSAHLPAAYRSLYEEVLAELRRFVPRLADRLGAAKLPSPAVDPLAPDEELVVRSARAAGPWLAWVRCGCGRDATRWERRLGTGLHVRTLPAGPPVGAASPDRWAATALHAAKQALADVIEDARGRAVIVGGAGAGAAMAAALAASAGAAGGPRGALLVAPAPLTAEGPRDLPDDVMHEIPVPVLAVCGGRGASALAGGGGGAARRVLLVAGADAALRLPLRARRRLRLPQHALDAALAEEMVRWCTELAAAPRDHHDDYLHLPALAPLTPPALASASSAASVAPPVHLAGGSRAIEFVEGRVVARVSGSTPLLLTPRRAPSNAAAPELAPSPGLAAAVPAPAALAAADIMQLPIVFADDEPPALAPIAPLAYSEGGGGSGGAGGGAGATDKPVTVRSGGVKGGGGVRYTRVIVAKRGAGAAGVARGPQGRGRGRVSRP